jgi:type VI secretion system protein ImpK
MANEDDSNKTVFGNQVNTDPNRTVFVPNPGRRINVETNKSTVVQNEVQSAQAVQPLQIQITENQNNPLVGNATTLITILTTLRTAVNPPQQPAMLQQELVREIRQFDARNQQLGLRSEACNIARYALCTALDEAALNTPWGVESGWSQKSLLSLFHNETNGGETFFHLLEQLNQRQTEFRDVLELFYILLSIGFQGRYRLDSRGKEKLDTLREQLFNQLYSQTRITRQLSPHWQSSYGEGSNRLIHYIPLWAVAAIASILVIIAFSGMRVWMHQSSVETVNQLNSINTATIKP